MSDEVEVTEVEQVSEVVVPVEVPEQVYTYQPTDENGRKLGAPQVLKYKTQDELIQKITDQNVKLVRKLREETKKNRLGIVEKEELPSDVQRFVEPPTFSPRQLTPDERVKLSRDLLDPEQSEAATDLLLESAIGMKPAVLMSTLNSISENNLKLLAKTESDAFVMNNPDYYGCMENFKTITSWMLKNDLAPVRENFQLAFDTLKQLPGVILERGDVPTKVIPVPVEPKVEVVKEVVPEREEILAEEPVEAPVRKVAPPPTGLTRNQTGEVVVPAPREKYSLKDINSMPSEEYKKRLLHEKGFAKVVQKLEAEAANNRKKKYQQDEE